MRLHRLLTQIFLQDHVNSEENVLPFLIALHRTFSVLNLLSTYAKLDKSMDDLLFVGHNSLHHIYDTLWSSYVQFFDL